MIRLTSFGVDTALTGHVQLDAQNPAEFRGDEAKASQGIEGPLDAGFHVTITAAAAGTWARPPSARSTLPASPISTSSALRPSTASWDKAAKIALLHRTRPDRPHFSRGRGQTPKRRRKAIDLVELKKAITWCTSSTALAGSSKCVSGTIGAGANKPLANTWSSNMRLPSAAPRRQTVHPHRPARPGQQIHRRRSPQAQQARRLRLGGHQGQGPQARPRDRRRPDRAVLRPPARQGASRSARTPHGRRAGRRLPLSGNRRPAHHHRRS